MGYSAASIIGLAVQCAPNVAPQTVLAIVQAESNGNPLALNVNGGPQPAPARSAAEAQRTAQHFVAMGYSVDLGLGQINSRNLVKLGLTWSTAFDPCSNIAALGRLLTSNFKMVLDGRAPQHALRIALSLYNTGSPSRGFRNGYVSKVAREAGIFTARPPTAIWPSAASAAFPSSGDAPLRTVAPGVSSLVVPPHWDVFTVAAFDRESRQVTGSERRKSVWSE